MRFLLAALTLVVLSSCASRYQRDFRAVLASQPSPPSSVEGPWLGQWKSEMNGHEGPLWCVVTEVESGKYDFRYRAGWGKLQFGDYIHRVAATPSGESSLSFGGKMDLPGGVGVHEVKGRLTTETFDARYRSDRGDRGTMILRRPR